MTPPPIGKQLRRDEDRATSSELIAAIEDLLTQILVRLPVKSLLRFKSVSKPWLALISSPHFCVLKSKRCRKHIIGLLLRHRWMENPKFDFVPFVPDQIAPFERLDFVDDLMCGLEFIQSCNGLLLCCTSLSEYYYGPEKAWRKYYVFNPTTRQRTTVPLNRILDSGKVSKPYIVNLAFDPRISPYFKLLCGYMTKTPGLDPEYHYEIGVYSSETGLMRQIDDHLHTNVNLLNTWALYWNGAINWIEQNLQKSESLYFNLDAECIRMLPMPPVSEETEIECGRSVRYYGESDDHLHLIQTNVSLTPRFNVYELDREYSGWFVRFRVDLQPVLRSFPDALVDYFYPVRFSYYNFGILSIVETADDEMAHLVLSVCGKAIRVNLKDGSFTKMCDFPAMNDRRRSLPVYEGEDAIQLAESLHPL